MAQIQDLAGFYLHPPFAAAFLAAISFFSLVPALKGIDFFVSAVVWCYLVLQTSMEFRAAEALKALRANDGSVDLRLASLGDLKHSIKQSRVPPGAIQDTFEAIRLAIASSNSQQLMLLGFTTLSNLLRRLHGQGEADVICLKGHNIFYALLTEKLSDQWIEVRVAASKAFTDFWTFSPPETRFEIEHIILHNVLTSKHPRPKVISLQWLSEMVKTHHLKFRPYLSSIVDCLEDADGTVRDTAKTTVIQIFLGTGQTAGRDLEKELHLHKVRKTIADAIIRMVEPEPQSYDDHTSPVNSVATPKSSTQSSLPPRPHTRAECERPTPSMSTRQPSRSDASQKPPATVVPNAERDASSASNANANKLKVPKKANRSVHHDRTQSVPEPDPEASSSSTHPPTARPQSHGSDTPASSTFETNDAGIQPMLIDSSKRMEEIITATRPHFEGRETEQNWTKREESILLMRRITKGNSPTDHRESYITCIHAMVEGILKAALTLRTSLMQVGCNLIVEIGKAIGHGVDPFVEILLQDLIKLCGNTKKIAADHGNIAVDALVASATINHRIVNRVWQACQDKNVQPRLFAAGWLKTLIRAHRQRCTKSGCLELIEKGIRKGLEDANPGVRTNFRKSYWTFAEYWPEKAQSIMSSLNAKSQNLLLQDPSNPNLASESFSRSTSILQENVHPVARPKPSIKDLIRAQKKSKETDTGAADLPSRPASAMSTVGEYKAPEQGKGKAAIRPAPKPAITAPTAAFKHSSMQSGSLSSAPVRPSARPVPRKPEVARAPEMEPQLGADEPDLEAVTNKGRVPPRVPHAERPTSKGSMTSPERSALKPFVANEEHQMPQGTAVKKLPTNPPKPKRFPAPANVGNTAKPMSQSSIPSHTASSAIVNESEEGPENEPSLLHVASSTVVDEPEKRTTSQHGHPESDPSVSMSHSDEENLLPNPLKGLSAFGDSANSRTTDSGKLRPEQNHSRQSSDELSHTAGAVSIYQDGRTMHSNGADDTISKVALAPPSNVLEDVSNTPKATTTLGAPPVLFPANFDPTLNESPLRGQGHPNPADEKLAARRWEKVDAARPKPIAPANKDRTKNRVVLGKFIEAIYDRSIDVMGFRRLQGIVSDHGTAGKVVKKHDKEEFGFEDLLQALIRLLESSDDMPKQFLGRSHDQKHSALATARMVFDHHPKYKKEYYPEVLSALIVGRQYFDSASHLSSGYQKLADHIIDDCPTIAVMESIINTLILQEDNEATDRCMIFGGGLLTRLIYSNQPALDIPAYETRLADVARNGLERSRAGVRRGLLPYVKLLFGLIEPESRFVDLVAGENEDLRNTVTYYVNRR